MSPPVVSFTPYPIAVLLLTGRTSIPDQFSEGRSGALVPCGIVLPPIVRIDALTVRAFVIRAHRMPKSRIVTSVALADVVLGNSRRRLST